MTELPGMWDDSDLTGGWADTEESKMRDHKNEGNNETVEQEISRHSAEDQAREAQRTGERSAEIGRALDGERRANN